jgi:hypothetical protein
MTSIFGNIKVILALFLLVVLAMVTILIPKPEVGFPSNSSGGSITLDQDDSLLAVNATILEVLSAHAWTNHGTEVNAAIRCLNNHGSTKSFITFGFKDSNYRDIKTNLWLCQEGDDWFAIVTSSLEKVGGNRIGRLITAYLVDKAKFLTIEDFITAVVAKWSAKEISFVIEAGSVFLQPK